MAGWRLSAIAARWRPPPPARATHVAQNDPAVMSAVRGCRLSGLGINTRSATSRHVPRMSRESPRRWSSTLPAKAISKAPLTVNRATGHVAQEVRRSAVRRNDSVSARTSTESPLMHLDPSKSISGEDLSRLSFAGCFQQKLHRGRQRAACRLHRCGAGAPGRCLVHGRHVPAGLRVRSRPPARRGLPLPADAGGGRGRSSRLRRVGDRGHRLHAV